MKLQFRINVLVEADGAIEDEKMVEDYVRDAVDGWSGGGDVDELRSIKVKRINTKLVNKRGNMMKSWETRRANAAANQERANAASNQGLERKTWVKGILSGPTEEARQQILAEGWAVESEDEEHIVFTRKIAT